MQPHLATRTPAARRPQAGLTLIELAVSFSVTAVLLGGVCSALLSETTATDASVKVLLAKAECDRAFVALLEDLHTTNTIEKDQAGVPYFALVDAGEGRGTKVRFRRCQGVSADATNDTVTMRYGAPVEYELTDQDQLVRTEDGSERVLANRVAACSFSVAPNGAITCRIVTFAGTGANRAQVENTINVTPRNGYDR
jgi:hypothetical protein